MPTVYGKPLDAHTRCVHYHSETDIIAIRFACCGRYYPCFECHEAEADHPATVWPQADWNKKAVLCGVCQSELTIWEYLHSRHTCPNCHAAFNPGCKNHYHLYFDMG